MEQSKTFIEVLKSEDIAKFNPYHDKLGRFTTAGSATSFTYKPGASTAHDRAIEREKQRTAAMGEAKPNEPDKPKTTREAEKYAEKHLGFAGVAYDGLDVETANHVNDTIAKIQEKYPELKGTVQIISQTTRSGVCASMSINSDFGSDGVPRQYLQLGNHYSNGMDELINAHGRMVSTGWSPKGTDPSSTIWHEYGHAYANFYRAKAVAEKIPDNRFWRSTEYHNAHKSAELEKGWIKTAAKELKITQKQLKANISQYATTNAHETWAEAFSEYHTSANPRPECVALMRAAGIAN